MADRDDAVLAIKQYGGQYQAKSRIWLAYLGDGNGAVNTSDPTHCLARYPLQSSPTHEVYNMRTARIDNLRVFVGYTVEEPNKPQVLSVADPRIESPNTSDTPVSPSSGSYGTLAPHAVSHMYLNVDPVYVNWRQITPLGVFPDTGLTVQIRGGYIPRPGADIYVSDQTLDMTSSVPGSGARYSLISFDADGDAVVTDGTINSGGFAALTFADIPDTPAGNWRSCAIALYVGQTAIVETQTEIDFFDLRFPEEINALGTTIALSDLPLTNTHIIVGNASNEGADVALSGDATIANTGAMTLATVNSNVGTFGDSSNVAQVTVNAKGLITAAANVAISAGAGQVTGIARWTAAESQTTFDLPDTAEYLLLASINGLIEDPALYSLSSDGTQLIFDTGLSASDVVTSNYIILQV